MPFSDMNILAVVVTYNPDAELIRRNIAAFEPYVSKCIIWENSGHIDFSDLSETIEYYGNGENVGISKALNFAWRYAKENGYSHLLTMDQDSVFADFPSYLCTAKEIIQDKECVIGPWYFHPLSDKDQDIVIERDQIITSGMIVPVSILDSVNGYCEDFTVDAIDIEFCARVRYAGYSVLQSKYDLLQQNFGSTYSKKVFGHVFSGPAYGPNRLYGIFRNYIIIYRRYGHPEYIRHWINWYLGNYVPNIIFAEKQKIPKLWAIFKGVVAGICYPVRRSFSGKEHKFSN